MANKSGQYVKIFTNLTDFIDMSMDELNAGMRAGVTLAANDIAKQAQLNLVSRVSGARNTLPEGGSLYDGIRCFTWRDAPAATVHIYGNLGHNDGTWRLRFFNGGTKDRYHKKMVDVPGKKRKAKSKGRYVGKITPTNFFDDALTNIDATAKNYMIASLSKRLSTLASTAKYDDMMARFNAAMNG